MRSTVHAQNADSRPSRFCLLLGTVHDESPPLLTASQRRIVGVGLTLLALYGSATLLITGFVALARLVEFFSSVLWPLAVAGVFALILRPVVEWLQRRLHLRRLFAVLALYGVFLLVVAGVLLLVVPPLVEQLLNFIAYLPTLWGNIAQYVQDHYPQWVELAHRQLEARGLPNLTDAIGNQSKEFLAHALPSLRAAFGGLLDVFAFVTHIAIIPVYLLFLLLARETPQPDVARHLTFLQPGVREDIDALAREFVAIIETFFRGQLLIAGCMAALYAIGFTAIGLKFGLLIGLAIGLLNIVPYLGTIIGLGTALPLAYFQPGGGWQLVGLVLVVKLLVQCVESWVLTPKIMGHRTGLHPATIIFAIFFWGVAFGGILGMVLAVPLTAFFVTVWRLLKRKYLQAEPS